MTYHWPAQPLHTHIIEQPYTKKGHATDADLYEALTKTYGEASYHELNKVLIKLEIHDPILVSRLTKNVRQIEFVSKITNLANHHV